MMPRSLLVALLVASPALAVPSPGAQATPAALEVRVFARAFVPGEPLRLVVIAGEQLKEASARVGSESVTLVASPLEGSSPGARWIGWTVLDLDHPAGPLRVEASATTAAGAKLQEAIDIRVGTKSFPEQKLEVEGKYVSPPKAAQERIARDTAKLARVYATRREPPATLSPFVRPVSGEPTGVFGSRRVFNGEKRAPHSGLDLRAATGTPVACSGPGVVALAEDLYFSGNTIIVDHGAGLFTLYAHLSKMNVKVGEAVAAGAEIGLSGATGRVTGPHLHWGGKVGKNIFDPTALLDPALFGEGAAPAADQQ